MLKNFPTVGDIREFFFDEAAHLNFYIDKIEAAIKEAITTTEDGTTGKINVDIVIPSEFIGKLEKMAIAAGWKDTYSIVAPVMLNDTVQMEYTLCIKGEI